MDLGAYIQIESLYEIAAKNNISVPRLRGYRLMKEEIPVDLKSVVHFEYEAYNLIREYFIRDAINKYIPWQLDNFSRTKNKAYYSRKVRLYTNTDKCVNKYYDYFEDKEKPFPWYKFHGKLRRKLKLLYKQCSRKSNAQYEVFNKYVGRNDVLYIHARIGGNNWKYFNGEELEKQPWFLEKVDDCFDSTYCDIYAKINIEDITNG